MSEDTRNEEEQTVMRVTDRRKFNPDGSLREGVVIETEKKPEEESAAESLADSNEIEPAVSSSDLGLSGSADEGALEDDLDAIESEDPASFINFLSTLVANAASSLGAMPHPVTGQKSVDLETGKFWIDVLTMLRKKTDGNLSSQEERIFDNILSDLQLQYVAITRAAEEQLKAQAAQKFSSKDILGG